MFDHVSIADRRMVLALTPAKEGGYVVTSPLDPELITQAKTIPEAFEMARDAVRSLALRAPRGELSRSSKLSARLRPPQRTVMSTPVLWPGGTDRHAKWPLKSAHRSTISPSGTPHNR